MWWMFEWHGWIRWLRYLQTVPGTRSERVSGTGRPCRLVCDLSLASQRFKWAVRVPIDKARPKHTETKMSPLDGRLG